MELFFKEVNLPEELDILAGQKDDYESLHFLYTADSIQKYKDLLKNETSYQIIALSSKNEFVGFVSSAEKLFPGYLFLGELFVNPNSQSKGIGTQLVGKVIDHAKQKNLAGVYTETELINEPAQRLYEKCGFQKAYNPNWEGITYKIQF